MFPRVRHRRAALFGVELSQNLGVNSVLELLGVYSFSGMAGSTAMACIHCKKTQAVVEMTQDRNRKWVCWQCSYPECSGCKERCPAEIVWELLSSVGRYDGYKQVQVS